MYDQERLLIIPGTSQMNTFLSLACRRTEIGRYGQERLLSVLGTSQCFFYP